MAVFNGVFPIQAGKEEDARSVRGGDLRRSARRTSRRTSQRVGVTRETWALQETPMGSLMLVWFEGDVEKAFTDLATNDSEYMTWFRAQVLDVTGVDLGHRRKARLLRSSSTTAPDLPRGARRRRRRATTARRAFFQPFVSRCRDGMTGLFISLRSGNPRTGSRARTSDAGNPSNWENELFGSNSFGSPLVH